MQCPECEGESLIIDTKLTNDIDGWSMVQRVRRCATGHRFTTYECYEAADVEVIFYARDALALLNRGKLKAAKAKLERIDISSRAATVA